MMGHISDGSKWPSKQLELLRQQVLDQRHLSQRGFFVATGTLFPDREPCGDGCLTARASSSHSRVFAVSCLEIRTNTCRYTSTQTQTYRVEFRLKHIESSYRGVTLQPNPNVYGTNTTTEVSSEATAFWGSTWHRWGCNDPTARHPVIGGSKYRYIGPAGQRSPGC